MTVLVTGANGFVGSAVCLQLTQAGIAVRPLVRTVHATAPSIFSLPPVVADLERNTNWIAGAAPFPWTG